MKTRITAITEFARFASLSRYCIPALVIAIIIITAPAVQAEVATTEEMEQVCRNWLTYIVAETGGWAGTTAPDIVNIQDIVENDTLVGRFYAIDPRGYIVVPVLKELPPVKAYSDENSLDIFEPDGFALLLRQVLRHRTQLYAEVYGSLDIPQPVDDEPLYDRINRQKWDWLAVSAKAFSASMGKNLMGPLEGVGPLLTTAWHQGAPYNNLCPIGYGGGRCVVGCVATAAAQIIYYHRWPREGVGSHSYYWNGDNSCSGGSTPGEMLTADFSDPYAYDDSPAAVAEISYEMGVAFNMDYGACGSGAYTLDGADILPAYFLYDESARREYRNAHTEFSWFNLIKGDINKGRPILYRIYSHAIVCDGWRVFGGQNQYHFNYGWGGGNNAWYTVDYLYCPWSGCDPMVEGMVCNIIPLYGRPWLSHEDFFDIFGDGDSVLEAGETVELTFTIANYGMEPITDVSIELAIDDASLIIVDGSVFLGTIEPNDSIANTGDPMIFEIPADYIPRTDSIMLIATYNGTSVDTMVVEKAIGGVRVLLVDDDENANLDAYYRDILGLYRVPFDTWVHSAYLPPDSDYMSTYDIVIWFTGDYRSFPLSNNEIAAMTGYLNGGGKLFLTGQRIAAELATIDPDFLNNYLMATYEGTEVVPVLNTEAGQVFAAGHRIAIVGGDGASNQEYPDLIAPAGGAVAELLYIGETDYGAVSYSGTYQLVFFSFGFEAIVSNDSRWLTQGEVMTSILNFFSYQTPNGCPAATDLTATPGDPNHLLDHTPTLTWTYVDGEASPQAMYHVQVGTDANWATAEMWDYGPIAGSETAVVYDGLELVDGGQYFIRCRVHDGSLWSAWTSGTMRMNSIPDAPTGLNPSEMQGVATGFPYLSHTNAADSEHDAIVHDYELYADSQMTLPIDHAEDIPAGYGTSRWQVTIELADDSVYFWRVRGSDPYEEGPWCDLAKFWVNSINSQPTAFDLVSPGNGTKTPTLLPTLIWNAAADADPYDNVRYTLYYSKNPNFVPSWTLNGLETTSHTITDSLQYGTLYYWKVRAYDLFSGVTLCNQVFSFTTIPKGDANGDGIINVADAVFIITHVFKGGPAPVPLESGDANCDGNVNVGDAVTLINYIFKGGEEPGCH